MSELSPMVRPWMWMTRLDPSLVEASGQWAKVDCRDFAIRARLLHLVAQQGHRRPWALGSCWSPLSDEQAGRATAEIVRRVGSVPGSPRHAVPYGVMGTWTAAEEGRPAPRARGMSALTWRRLWLGDEDQGRYMAVFEQCWLVDIRPWDDRVPTEGSESGEVARRLADASARVQGALLLEMLGPGPRPAWCD